MTDSALRVTRVTWEAEGVVGVRLSSVGGSPLPEWGPGAHLDLKLPSGLRRQYSLCGDPADRLHYDIAVRLEDAGRGGSAEIHDTALVGKQLVVNHLRNHFTLGTADSYLLIAGGIGVTPLVPMARELAARGADWSALYCGHGTDTMAFREEFTRVGGDRVSFVDTAVAPRPNLKELIGALAPGAVVYCCGPVGLLDAVTEICEASGVRYETEHFSAAVPDIEAVPGDEVELELREAGITVVADADTTLLEAIRGAGIDIESDCEEGYCGTCETRVLEGTPDHRDVVLSKAERAAGKTFFPCVSRACGLKLVLDL
ncbi:MAG: hypothetical protein QOI78_6962 [Actinomycetota bacterium]|nr:hypothetical protein [Actinomycetota bacterium]